MDKENYDKIMMEVEEKAKKEVSKKYSPDMLGYTYTLENEKKRILKEDYEIELLSKDNMYDGKCID